MAFPVLLFGVHPHRVFDALSLLVGAQLFWWLQRRSRAPFTSDEKWTLAAGCLVGAALGAKLLVFLEEPRPLSVLAQPAFWLGGKSIVGALLGGLAGVEIAKKLAGITRRTGDAFVVPLSVGLAIGRVGCFLSGLTDDAYGVRTDLPWGVDFGDGPRHPTQLYEVGFALVFLAAIPWLRARTAAEGDLFRVWLATYFAFRFLEEFLRVAPRPWLGFTVYQWACVAGLTYLAAERRGAWRGARRSRAPQA